MCPGQDTARAAVGMMARRPLPGPGVVSPAGRASSKLAYASAWQLALGSFVDANCNLMLSAAGN